MIDFSKVMVGQDLGQGGQGRVMFARTIAGQALALKVIELRPDFDRELVTRRLGVLSRALLFGWVWLADAPLELRRQLAGPSGALPKAALVVAVPFVAGASLFELSRAGRLEPREAAAVLWGIASRLVALPAGVAHGDLRAPNVFVQPSGDVELIDFDVLRMATPREDLIALGQLGLTLCPRGEDAELDQLVSEIDGSPSAPTASEIANRSAAIATRLGAPPGLIGSVLRARVAPIYKGEPVLNVPAPGAKPGGRRLSKASWLAGGAALVAVAAAIAWLAGRPSKFADALVPGANAPSGSTPSPSGGLYDSTGTVHYDGPVHELRDGELAARGDGFIQLNVQETVPSVGLSSVRGGRFWSRAKPAPGSIYLDVKPGDYTVDIQRQLADGTIFSDYPSEHVDALHPWRLPVTNQIMSAPSADDGPRPKKHRKAKP